jgi:hypothetical protein
MGEAAGGKLARLCHQLPVISPWARRASLRLSAVVNLVSCTLDYLYCLLSNFSLWLVRRIEG